MPAYTLRSTPGEGIVADEFRLKIVDLAPVVDALGRILPKESDPEAALGAVGLAGRADFRGGRANTR